MQDNLKLTQYSKGGGCGCKIAPAVLQQILTTTDTIAPPNLLVGNESSDDAAVYQLNDTTAIISTTDFFMPIVDDPFDFGAVAAANAISDVYAMGGTPIMAVAILGWPIDKLPTEAAQKVLDGGRSICHKAGIPMAGGHTIDSADPIFGLAVTGTVPLTHLKKNNGAKPGDLLFLTKPLGVGLLSTALKRGVLQDGHYPILIDQLTALNRVGQKLGGISGVHALTDVTGFGLLGHLIEMAEGSGTGAILDYSALPRIEGVDIYLKERTIPDATFRNWNSYSKLVKFDKGVNVMEAFNLLPDPQTNGGLLIAVDPAFVDQLTEVLNAEGLANFTKPIGRMEDGLEKLVHIEP